MIRMPMTDVIARRVSQLRVEVTSEYSRKLARLVPSGAARSYEISVPEPTANGQNHRFMSRPNTYEATAPYPQSIAISVAPPRRRGRRPATAPTHAHANIWNGVQGPKVPVTTVESAIVAMPRSIPNRAPNARPARISRMKTASTPPTPVLAMRTAAPIAARVPRSASM
jgi:hypothetical protein